jgi:hypothetical protein
MASDDSWPEFWHDEFLMWETLYTLGFKDENIFVFYEDGDDVTGLAERYDSYENYGIEAIVDYDANRSTILDILKLLSYGSPIDDIPEITENDFLFIWTFGAI